MGLLADIAISSGSAFHMDAILCVKNVALKNVRSFDFKTFCGVPLVGREGKVQIISPSGLLKRNDASEGDRLGCASGEEDKS